MVQDRLGILPCFRGQAADQAVGPALHIHEFGGKGSFDVEYTVIGRFRGDASRRRGVDPLRGYGRPDDDQFLPPPVDVDVDHVARFQVVGLGEGLGHDHFVAAVGAEIVTTADDDVIDDWLSPVGQGQDQSADRPGNVLQVDDERNTDAVPDLGHARGSGQGRDDGHGDFFQIDPKVGHAAVRVIAHPGRFQIAPCPLKTDQAAYSDGDDGRDGRDHPLGLPQVPPQFPAQDTHQAMSSARARRSFS